MNSNFKNDIIINVDNLTKDFGNGKGVFNFSFTVKKGKMIGFVGTIGSGKSTTIRSIVGLIKPTSGNVQVFGLDSWKYSSKFISNIGYVICPWRNWISRLTNRKCLSKKSGGIFETERLKLCK